MTNYFSVSLNDSCYVLNDDDGFVYQNDANSAGQYLVSYAFANAVLNKKISEWKVSLYTCTCACTMYL